MNFGIITYKTGRIPLTSDTKLSQMSREAELRFEYLSRLIMLRMLWLQPCVGVNNNLAALSVVFGLNLKQLLVFTLQSNQLVMAAHFHNFALFQEDNPVAKAGTRQPM